MHFKNFQSINSQNPNNTLTQSNNNQYTFSGYTSTFLIITYRHQKLNNQKAFSANNQNSSQFMNQSQQRVSRNNNDYSCVQDNSMNKSFTSNSRFMPTPIKNNDNYQFSRMFENKETKTSSEYKSPFIKDTRVHSEDDYQRTETRQLQYTKQQEPKEMNNTEMNSEILQKSKLKKFHIYSVQEQIQEIVAAKIEHYCEIYFQDILINSNQEAYFDEKIKDFQQQMLLGQQELQKMIDRIEENQQTQQQKKQDLSNVSQLPVNVTEGIHKQLISQRSQLQAYTKQSDSIIKSIHEQNSKWEQLQVKINTLVNNNNILNSERSMLIKEEISQIQFNVVGKKTRAKK